TWRSQRRAARRWTPSMRRRWPRAGGTTGRRAPVRTTGPATTPLSSSTPTATGWRRSFNERKFTLHPVRMENGVPIFDALHNRRIARGDMGKPQIIGSLKSTYTRVACMALEEKGVGYELTEALLGGPEVRAIHPFGRMPVMRHGDVALFESKAIATYVDRAFDGPALIP